MRKFLISAAVAASALAVATPAAAQWQQPRGYANGYGQNNGYAQARSLQHKIDTIQAQINYFDRLNRISNREAQMLRHRSLTVERQLRAAAYRGLSRYERDAIEQNIAQLRWQVRAEANEGRRWSRNDYRSRDYNRDYNRDRYDD